MWEVKIPWREKDFTQPGASWFTQEFFTVFFFSFFSFKFIYLVCLFLLIHSSLSWKPEKDLKPLCKAANRNFRILVVFCFVLFIPWFWCQEKRGILFTFFWSHLIICIIDIPFRYEYANTMLNRWCVFLLMTSWRGKSDLSLTCKLLMEPQYVTPKWCQPHDPIAILSDLGRGKVTIILNLVQL